MIIDPVDAYDATPHAQKSDTHVKDASVLEEAPLHSLPHDNSTPPSLNDTSPMVKRKRGRPRRQIPSLETNPLEIEPKRRLRRRRPAGLNEATPPAQMADIDFNDPSVLDKSPAHSLLDGNAIPSFSTKNPSPTEHQNNGRPQHQIKAIDTDPLKIETDHEPRRRRKPARAQTEDPWALLSKTPAITPSSPFKPHKARPPVQKQVINLSCCPYKPFH